MWNVRIIVERIIYFSFYFSNTMPFLSLSPFATTLEVCLGSLSIWKNHLRPSFKFLIDALRCCFNISTYFPSAWCHLFCEVHQSLLQQSTPTTWCCHPRASQLGWCSSACKLPPFSSKHNDGHYGQHFYFCFIRPEDISPKSTTFVPMWSCKL